MTDSTDCLFCKIVDGDILAEKVFENENVVAFKDISPQAPTHLLFIPKEHVVCVSETTDHRVFANVLGAMQTFTVEQGIKDFRVAINNGAGAGQTVFHLHLHLLAGREFSWPPG